MTEELSKGISTMSDERRALFAELTLPKTSEDIRKMASVIDGFRTDAVVEDESTGEEEVRQVAAAQKLLKQFRQGQAHFGVALFANPAWEILLDLFVQRSLGVQTSIISLCVTASSPTAITLRYVRAMMEDGLLTQDVSAPDNTTVRLSDHAFEMAKTLLP